CSTLHLLRSDSVGPGCLAAPATELSPTSNPGVVRQAFFGGGMSASGISVLGEVDETRAGCSSSSSSFPSKGSSSGSPSSVSSSLPSKGSSSPSPPSVG
nr:hypothetical protein [Tanacetum cinerariifolium]